MKFTKNLALSLVGLLAAGFTVGGVSALNRSVSLTVKAEDNATMTVDTLGNLSWEEVNGATGYSWSYTIGETTSKSYTAESNEVNVGLAIVEAAQAAKSEVTFNVTPNGVNNPTTATWTYPIERYINFGYSSHDISDVNVEYAFGEVPIQDTLSETTQDNRWTTGAVYKNDLLTIGLKSDVELDGQGVSFYLFNDRKGVTSTALVKNPNYRVRLLKNGTMTINNKGDAFTAAGDSATTNNTAVVLGEKYYFSMGVFDTYDISGTLIGETVYCSRSTYDESTDSLLTVSELSHFYTTTEIETAGIAYEYEPLGNAPVTDLDGNTIPVERSALIVQVHGTVDKDGDGTAETKDNYVYISSGKPTYKKIATPTALYYDNVDQTLCWNKVAGADGYEWRVGNEPWQKVCANKVSVSALLAKYKEYSYLPLSVRAIKGEQVSVEAKYNVDMSVFFKTQSVLKDLTEIYAFTDSTLKSYSQNSGNGAIGGGKMFDAPDLSLNTHVTFAFTTNEQTPATERFLLLRLFRDSSNMYKGQYGIAFWGDGTLFLTPNWNYTAAVDTSDLQTNMAGNFRVAKVADGFKVGVKYYVTFGIDEILKGETKVANRITVRVEEETENGLSRNTLGMVSYDFKYFDKWTEEKKLQLGAHSDAVSLWQAKNTSEKANVLVLANDKVVSTKSLKYGEWYDFSEELAAVNVDGYTIDGWTYGDEQVDFPAFGWWNRSVDTDGFLVEAKLSPIEYAVSYVLPNGTTSENPSSYTIESDWEVADPINLPDGKLFAGWYEASDTDFTTPITTLKGKTGDIELVARIVNGYTLSVNDQTFTWKEGEDAFVLAAPNVQGKTFVKWQVLSGTEYVDYTGETTFVPDESMSFKAIYDWTIYSITYVAEGSTHENVTDYTAETVVTFSKATKEGYFFLGWYEEDTFKTEVKTTANYAENLILYAKFEKILLPATITLDTNENERFLPVPQLPDGSQYTVELYKGTEKLQITDDAYVFTLAGEYVLKYCITLPTGEVVNHEISLTVRQVYTITLHYGNGETVVLKKYVGEKVTESELPIVADGFEFVGVYTDEQYTAAYDLNSSVSGDMNLYIKWSAVEEGEPKNEFLTKLFSGCGGSFGGSSAILAVLVLGATIFLLKRKER